MKKRADQIYQSLVNDLDKARRQFRCPEQQVEQCFHICTHYLAVLSREVAGYKFANAQDEVYFFKVIKPQFTSKLEFYSLYYHALLFKTQVADPVKLQGFWAREALRLQKFKVENAEFYAYYITSREDQDHLYFTRGTFHTDEADQATITPYDPLVANLLALEKYHAYVIEEMREVV